MRKAAILAFLAMAVTAMAAEHGAPAAHKKNTGHEAKKGGRPGTNVVMPFLMALLTN